MVIMDMSHFPVPVPMAVPTPHPHTSHCATFCRVPPHSMTEGDFCYYLIRIVQFWSGMDSNGGSISGFDDYGWEYHDIVNGGGFVTIVRWWWRWQQWSRGDILMQLTPRHPLVIFLLKSWGIHFILVSSFRVKIIWGGGWWGYVVPKQWWIGLYQWWGDTDGTHLGMGKVILHQW